MVQTENLTHKKILPVSETNRIYKIFSSTIKRLKTEKIILQQR